MSRVPFPHIYKLSYAIYIECGSSETVFLLGIIRYQLTIRLPGILGDEKLVGLVDASKGPPSLSSLIPTSDNLPLGLLRNAIQHNGISHEFSL